MSINTKVTYRDEYITDEGSKVVIFGNEQWCQANVDYEYSTKNGDKVSNMKIKPLYDRVVIETIEEESKTPGGLIIPDVAKDKPKTGKVVATGPGNYTIRGELMKLEVKTGDTVIFNKNSGSETKLNGKTYLVMKESELIGIIEE